MKTLIYGGTGWVGKSLIAYLINSGINVDDLIVVSSKRKKIRYKNFLIKTINPNEFLDIKNTHFTNYYDFAFLPKSKINDIGKEKFIEITNRIIKNSEDFINKNHVNKALLASSGAVYNAKLINDSYGIQKIKQEEFFKKSCIENGVNYKVARIFSLIAPHYDLDDGYALNNFLSDAFLNKNLLIHSEQKVLRSYLIIETLFDYFQRNDESEIFDAWNFQTDIVEIAKIIADMYNLKTEFSHDYYVSKSTNSYISKDFSFQKKHKLKLKKEQIKNIIFETEKNNLLISH